VITGNSADENHAAISNTGGNTNPNRAMTATIAITTKIIGYINAHTYLFLISAIYSYS
jgi:3-oxoacyl-(acyl-carrier-protein) synthase